MIQSLTDIKFYKAGNWALDKGDLTFDSDKLPTNLNALYAFVVDEEVVYVGKTTNSLKKRLNQYQKPHATQRTNMKVQNEILNVLSKNGNVDIYVFVENNPEYVGQFELNKAAGLEDSIIKRLNPAWNNTGKELIGEEAMTSLEETPEQIILANYSTLKTLRKLGYSKARICEQMYMSEEELLDLETQYHELTGK